MNKNTEPNQKSPAAPMKRTYYLSGESIKIIDDLWLQSQIAGEKIPRGKFIDNAIKRTYKKKK